MNRDLIRIAVFLAAFTVLALSSAGACPVCYGAADSGSTQGMTAAIFSLLGVTGAVLGAFAAMFLRIRSRTRLILAQAATGAPSENATLREAESHG
jgi:hypothetical protein